MTDVGEEAYEALCTALSTGSDTAKLSPSGALVDVECAVAVREADTTMSLFTGVLEEVYATTSSAGQEEEVEEEDEGVLLDAAREAIERVEPGYLTSRDQLTFVRGEGMMDGEGREGVRERAAESWGGATGRLRGGYSGAASAVRPAVRAPLVRAAAVRPHLLKRQRRTTAPFRMGLLEDAMDGDISAVFESMAIGVAALVGSSTAWSLVQRGRRRRR